MSASVIILGRQPELSVAELVALQRTGRFSLSALNDRAVMAEGVTSPAQLLAQSGGIVKIGEIIDRVPAFETLMTDAFLQKIPAHLAGKGKAVFGVSVYGDNTMYRWSLKLGKELKQLLAANGRPARFLTGERGILSSVVVAKERLVERGAELLLIETAKGVVVAKTIAVQAFEDFSDRDYGRPRRDHRSGMLPPKLARIMVNLAGVDASAKILDPFCGSGTVLQEALMLGYTSVTGTDGADKAVRETRENLLWLAQHHDEIRVTATVKRSDIQGLGKLLQPASVDAVVTEPYLGPPDRPNEDDARFKGVRSSLEDLYAHAFRIFARLLRPGGRVVFVFPVFFRNAKPRFITNLDILLSSGFRLIQPLPPDFMRLFKERLTYRNTLLYHRPGQRVGREIILSEKT